MLFCGLDTPNCSFQGAICSQLNEPGGFSGSLPPEVLPICYCIYFKANKYDDIWLQQHSVDYADN